MLGLCVNDKTSISIALILINNIFLIIQSYIQINNISLQNCIAIILSDMHVLFPDVLITFLGKYPEIYFNIVMYHFAWVDQREK